MRARAILSHACTARAGVARATPRHVDAVAQIGCTLKHLGLWPSGQLRCRVVGSDEAFDAALLNLVRLPSADRA